MKPVFVVLVTYRRFNHFKRTIESLIPTLPDGSNILIVDNDSENSHDVLDYVATCPLNPRVRIDIMLNENTGWGKAMNLALSSTLEWRHYDYVLESNNDVTYEPDWFEKAKAMMESHSLIGILGLWKHENHGVQQELADGLLVKDDMPACAWLFRSADLETFLPFKEKGSTSKRGGNGEDSDMTTKVHEKGLWICGMKEDLAHHMDGYDTQDLGKENEAYR